MYAMAPRSRASWRVLKEEMREGKGENGGREQEAEEEEMGEGH